MGTCATAATTRGIMLLIPITTFNTELFDASIVPNHFLCQRAKSLWVGAGSEAFPGAGPPFCLFGTTLLPCFRAGRGRGAWRRRCLLLGSSPRNIILLRHHPHNTHSTTQHAAHVICLTNSLPSGFSFFFVGGRLRPRLHRDTTLIPLFFQTFFYAQSYNNHKSNMREARSRSGGRAWSV